MDTEQIILLINAQFEGAQTVVTGQGGKFEAQVVSNDFAGLNTVKRHQRVYAAVNQQIADGSIHALSIKAYTPEEFSEK
ncbi:MAG: BolA family protein [Candidatus Oxydemutatoraceae bacterium WSBS_2016_MAG_OTU14]